MFKKQPASVAMDTLLGQGTLFEGNVRFKGGMRVDGEVRGHISGLSESVATLVVSESGRVEGDISVDRVIINGEVVGSVRARDSVELMPKARVSGDIRYKKIEMHMGAQANGALIYEEAPVSGNIVDIKSHQQLS